MLKLWMLGVIVTTFWAIIHKGPIELLLLRPHGSSSVEGLASKAATKVSAFESHEFSGKIRLQLLQF